MSKALSCHWQCLSNLTRPTQRNVLRYRRVLPNGDWKLLQGPADIYMVRSIFHSPASLILVVRQLSLFVYDVLQAIGGILDIRWIHQGIVTTGSYCTAQGIIQQTGELGVALITLVCTFPYCVGFSECRCTTNQILTVHTFVVALWRVGIRARHFAFGIVALATLYVVLWVSIGNGIHKHYETPTPVRISDFLIAASTDIVWLVLVLDRPSVRWGTLSRGICLALDRFICLIDHVHPTLLLDEGPFVDRPREVVQVSI